jgi:hypothetical protein
MRKKRRRPNAAKNKRKMEFHWDLIPKCSKKGIREPNWSFKFKETVWIGEMSEYIQEDLEFAIDKGWFLVCAASGLLTQ